MLGLSLAVSALLAAAPSASTEAVDCAREIADARRLYEAQTAERLRFAEPLTRAVRHVIDHTLADEDRALIRGFKQGAVTAGALDRKVWPKLRRAFARFNAADCRHLGGVAGSEELVDALTALRGDGGLHTSVVVTCARRIPLRDGRRHLGLRVRADDDGPTVVLQGLIERSEVPFAAAYERGPTRRLVFQIPLGDRSAEIARYDEALAEYTGSEAEFSWIVPARCKTRISSAGLATP